MFYYTFSLDIWNPSHSRFLISAPKWCEYCESRVKVWRGLARVAEAPVIRSSVHDGQFSHPSRIITNMLCANINWYQEIETFIIMRSEKWDLLIIIRFITDHSALLAKCFPLPRPNKIDFEDCFHAFHQDFSKWNYGRCFLPIISRSHKRRSYPLAALKF